MQTTADTATNIMPILVVILQARDFFVIGDQQRKQKQKFIHENTTKCLRKSKEKASQSFAHALQCKGVTTSDEMSHDGDTCNVIVRL